MSVLPPSEAHQTLRLTQCPKCFYQLAGLPEEGICPECGRAFDQRMVVLYGAAMGSKAQAHNAAPSAFGWATLALLAPLIYWAWFIMIQARWMAIACLGLVAATAAIGIGQRLFRSQPGPVQLRFDSQGCAQRDCLDKTSVWWDLQKLIWVMWFALFLAASALAGEGLNTLLMFGIMGALFAPLILWACRCRSKRLAANPNAGEIDLISITPWRRVLWVELQPVPTPPLRYRVRVRKKLFWRLEEGVIDTEVKMSTEQASQLKNLIRQYRHAGD